MNHYIGPAFDLMARPGQHCHDQLPNGIKCARTFHLLSMFYGHVLLCADFTMSDGSSLVGNSEKRMMVIFVNVKGELGQINDNIGPTFNQVVLLLLDSINVSFYRTNGFQ